MWTTIHSDYSRVGSRAIEEWIWSEQRAVEADQLTIMSELHLMQLRGAELWKQVLCPSKIERGEGEACGRARVLLERMRRAGVWRQVREERDALRRGRSREGCTKRILG
jgi:hypothetical protein